MSRLENIVRPFQTREISPPRTVLKTYAVENQKRIKLAIGKTGKPKVMAGSYSSTQSVYMDTKLKEFALQSSDFGGGTG